MNNIINFPLLSPTDPDDLALCCSGCREVEFILLATGDIQCSNCECIYSDVVWGLKEPEIPPAA